MLIEEGEQEEHINAHEAQLKYQQGFDIIKRLAEEGLPKAQVYMGDILFHQLKNPEQALAYFNAAAKGGSVEGLYRVALFLNKGWAGIEDKALSFDMMKGLADKGYDLAQIDLALCYLNGDGCEKNEILAFDYFKLAAEQGNPVAQNDLGLCFMHGEGTEVNYHNAFYCFNTAAKNQNSEAYYNMGVMFMNGLGVEQNMEYGANCFIAGAQMNNEKCIKVAQDIGINLNDYSEQVRPSFTIH